MALNFCGSLILRIGNFCFVLRELIFATGKVWFFFLGINFCDFLKVAFKSVELITILFFIWVHAKERWIKQHANVKQIHLCHSFTMDRQYLEYHLMHYPPSYLQHFLLQISIFVYNFYSGVNFCGKKIAVILFCENLFLQIAKKPTKIRARKHLVPHSTLINVLFACIIQSKLYSLDGL